MEIKSWVEKKINKAEINKIENSKSITRINKAKTWFCENIDKINKPLSRLTKEKRQKAQITYIQNENRDTQFPWTMKA